MTSTTDQDGSAMGRKVAALVTGIIAVAFLVAGLFYVAWPAGKLPLHFLGYEAGSAGHHALRLTGCFVVAVIFAALSWVILTYRPKPPEN